MLPSDIYRMLSSHQSKTTTRQRPVHSYDAFHTRSGNDKTNMVQPRQDNGKTKRSSTMFIFGLIGRLSDGRRGSCRSGLPAADLSDTERQSATRDTPHLPLPHERDLCQFDILLV